MGPVSGRDDLSAAGVKAAEMSALLNAAPASSTKTQKYSWAKTNSPRVPFSSSRNSLEILSRDVKYGDAQPC